MKIEMRPVISIPEALRIAGDCPCGEHAHSTFRPRSIQGRGRPYLTRIECALCGHWLVSVRNGFIFARIVTA